MQADRLGIKAGGRKAAPLDAKAGRRIMQNQLCISNAAEVFAGEKANFDPNYASYLKNSVGEFQKLVRKTAR